LVILRALMLQQELICACEIHLEDPSDPFGGMNSEAALPGGVGKSTMPPSTGITQPVT
jgi:hypothetical protein